MQPGRHPIVEHAQQGDQRDVGRIELGDGAEQYRERGLRAGVGDVAQPRAGGRGRGGRDLGARPGGQVSERAGGGGDHRAVLDRPGDAQVGVARAIERAEVAAHVVDREPLDVGARADDALAQRVVLEQQAARDVIGIDLDALLVVVFVDLLEHQLALELDVGEPRAGQQLAEHVERRRGQRGVERELEQRVVAAGLGVQRRAQLLDRGVERERGRVALGAAEQHVLGEVRQPVVVGLLEPCADLDEQGTHGGVQVRERDGGDREAVVERRRLDVGVQA